MQNNIQFRASGVGNLMVEPRSKSETLSETTKTHLVDIFVSENYGRRNDIHSKYIDKGNAVEEDGITLYSRASKTFFKKNEEHLSKGLVKGTPDLYLGESIQNANKIIDIKSSWDIFTFFRAKNAPINKLYYWQLQAYMYLSEASSASLVYCLIDTPENILNYEKGKVRGDEEACEELDKLHTYSDIPMNERFFEIGINRNDDDIEKMLKKCVDAIEYMNEKFYLTK